MRATKNVTSVTTSALALPVRQNPHRLKFHFITYLMLVQYFLKYLLNRTLFPLGLWPFHELLNYIDVARVERQMIQHIHIRLSPYGIQL